jgi:hypothetical protein
MTTVSLFPADFRDVISHLGRCPVDSPFSRALRQASEVLVGDSVHISAGNEDVLTSAFDTHQYAVPIDHPGIFVHFHHLRVA